MDSSNTQKYLGAHVEIRELIDSYTDIVNRRLWQQIPDIFASDSRWIATSPVSMEWKGLNNIIIELPKSVERMEVLIQTASSVRIHVESNSRATATSFMSEVGRNKETKESIRAIGLYEDLLTQEHGHWKFLERKFSLKYFDNQALTGKPGEYKY